MEENVMESGKRREMGSVWVCLDSFLAGFIGLVLMQVAAQQNLNPIFEMGSFGKNAVFVTIKGLPSIFFVVAAVRDRRPGSTASSACNIVRYLCKMRKGLCLLK